MKKRLCLIALLCFSLTALPREQTSASAQSVSKPFQIAANYVGPIRANTTAADLRRIYGPSHVVDKQLPGAEGETIDGSVVSPDSDSANRIEIFWTDKTHKHVSGVRLSTPGSKWRTVNGVGVGTSLADLVTLNKSKPIRFSGFDWDYGGIIFSWGGGPLAKIFDGKHAIMLQLGYAQGQTAKLSESEMKAVEGEAQISSKDPAIRKLKPYVDRISVDF